MHNGVKYFLKEHEIGRTAKTQKLEKYTVKTQIPCKNNSTLENNLPYCDSVYYLVVRYGCTSQYKDLEIYLLIEKRMFSINETFSREFFWV